MKPYRLILSFIFFFISLGIQAQSPHFEKYKVVKNKKNYEVLFMVQDSTGYIWINTSEGLIRFDGFEFKNISLPDSLSSKSITAMNIDYLNRLWLGFKNGQIAYVENEMFHFFQPEEGLGSVEISSIFFDSDSCLWYSTLGEGIYFFEGKYRKRLYNLNTDEGLNDNNAYTISQGKDQLIYIGTDNGIAIFDKKIKKFTSHLSMKDGLADNIVKQLQTGPDGNIWIAGEQGGLNVFDVKNKSFKVFPWFYGEIRNFVLQNDGDIWISTLSDGLVKTNIKNPEKYTQYQQEHGIHCNRTHHVFSDFENNVWISCKSGLSRCTDNTFEILDERENFSQNDIFSFITDSYDQYWVASSQGLFYCKKDENGKLQEYKFPVSDPKIASSFVSLFEDNSGSIWAGTYGYGVFKINPEKYSYQRLTSQNGLPNDNIISICGTSEQVWFSTLGGGACAYSLKDQKITTIFDQKNGLTSNYVYSIFPDSKKRIWIGLDGGGFSLTDGEKVLDLGLNDSLNIQTVYSFAEDKAGNIWFLSPDKGVFRYNNKSITNWEKINGLFSNQFKSISSNKAGNIVLSGSEGVILYNLKSSSFENLASVQDIAGFEPVVNGIHKDKDGSLWIAGLNQILVFKSQNQTNIDVEPKISIESVQLFFQPIEKNKKVFSYNENNLSFRFTGFWFQSPDKLLYRYKLENYDFNWSTESKSTFVTYSNLPSGTYTFKVQVSTKPGVWIDNSKAQFTFTIKPPFWLTWWFILLSIIALILIIYSIFKIRLAKLKQAKEQLEEEVKKRTATIMLQKEEIETQRDEIEAQRDFVIEQRDQISLQNKNITDSINYASRIQKALLPASQILNNYVIDYFILNRPMHIVSGDFYWCAEKNEKLYLAVADCTGHGVPGAFMSVLGLTLLNDIIGNASNIHASDILNELRNKVKIALQQKGTFGEAQDGMDISLIIYDKKQQIVQYSGANNPLYLIRNQELHIFKPDKMPIGIFVYEQPFNQQEIKIEPGDQIYLFSDGYMDQIGGPKESKLKSKTFGEWLIKYSVEPMNTQHDLLDKSMDEWKNGMHQNDDILIIGINL